MSNSTASNIIVSTPTKGTLDSLGRNKGMINGEQVISASRNNALTVSPYELFIEDGFNVRDIDQDHVIALAAALKNGQVLPPIEVKLVEVSNTDTGEKSFKVKVIDGHHRTLAYHYAKEQFGLVFDKVSVLNFEGSERDELVKMVVSTQNRKLTVIERAFAYARMSKQGMKNIEIAEAVNDNQSMVGNLLKLSQAPKALLSMIENKEIAISNVFALMRDCSNFDAVLNSAILIAEEKQERKSEKASLSLVDGESVSEESEEEKADTDLVSENVESTEKTKKAINVSKFKKASLNKKEHFSNQTIVKSISDQIPARFKETGLPEGESIQVTINAEMLSLLIDMSERMADIEEHNKQAEIEQMKLSQAKKGEPIEA